MKSLGKLVIGIATLFILLHSITPHTHQKNNDPQKSFTDLKTEANLVEWLKFIFHPDLGEDHLENYQNENPVQLLFANYEITTFRALSLHWVEETLQHETRYYFLDTSEQIFSAYSWRGPPSLG